MSNRASDRLQKHVVLLARRQCRVLLALSPSVESKIPGIAIASSAHSLHLQYDCVSFVIGLPHVSKLELEMRAMGHKTLYILNARRRP